MDLWYLVASERALEPRGVRTTGVGTTVSVIGKNHFKFNLTITEFKLYPDST